MYLLGADVPDASVCALGFDMSLLFPFIILGDNFLQNNTVIFNKTSNMIGLVPADPKPIIGYLGSGVRFFLNLFQIILIIGGGLLIWAARTAEEEV